MITTVYLIFFLRSCSILHF